jgi:hypothetical protein
MRKTECYVIIIGGTGARAPAARLNAAPAPAPELCNSLRPMPNSAQEAASVRTDLCACSHLTPAVPRTRMHRAPAFGTTPPRPRVNHGGAPTAALGRHAHLASTHEPRRCSSRRLRQDAIRLPPAHITTCATLDLLLKHKDETLATYN